MYEAVRTRAPVSTRMTGVSAMVLGLMLAGYAFANGLGAGIVEALNPATTMVTLPYDEPPPVDKVLADDFSTTVDAPEPPPPTPPDDVFTAEKSVIKVDPVRPPPETGAKVAPPPRDVVRGLPRMLVKDRPEYPPIAIRKHLEGVTGLDVCVDPKGRVTSVSLASSSGHDVLDKAALKWVHGVRFAPGVVDGQAAAMCGARVLYEWKIVD